MAQAETGQSVKMPFSVKFAIFCVIVTAVIFFPTTILFCGCMIPTFVAALVDSHQQKTAWLTVGCMNFAGTVPAWFMLWESGQQIDQAFNLLLQASTLIVAYGAAGVGWLIYLNITPFVAGIMVMKNERRLKDIEKRQKELVRKWGGEVAGQ